MKYLHKLVPLLLALLLLAGCTGGSQAETTPPTEPPTQTTAPTTEATEPPTEPPTERPLTAAEVYYKAKKAAPEMATQFVTNEKFILRTGANGVTIEMDMSMNKQATMSAAPFAINIQSETFTAMMGMEVEQSIQEYYREEGEDLVYYCDIEQLGLSFRQILEKDLYSDVDKELYPELDIELDAEWLLAMNGEYGYPPELYAPYIELEPEIQMLDGREVYVLCYQQTALWLFGSTGDAAVDADLGDIRIPSYWYVDAETFIPVKIEYSLLDLDPMVTAAMVAILNIQLPEDVTGLELEIVEYTYSLTDMVFDPVEVPEIPEEVLQRAEEYTEAA